MRKFTLFSLVEKICPKEKVYHTDMLFEAHGHTVIWLPPYMCDLNPIELAWRQLKDYVRSHNTAGDMSLTRLQELVQEVIKGVIKEDWAGYCRYVTNIENSYWEKDTIMEDIIDNFIINLGDTDSDEDVTVVLIWKMCNHLCLISFPYSAGKWTDVFWDRV
jgi:hypothetical protein